MLREARVIARLEHPGIVPVHDAGTLPDGRMFYAMKRVDGRRLDEIAPGASLPDRLRIFQKVCEAVAFAHAHGVLHRDLKPENVMVGPFGEVLVMDWGVARVLDEAPEAPPLAPREPPAAATAEGTVVGTPAYMAPEQAAGRAEGVGPAADIYALGGLLHFLLTGRPPFDEDRAHRRARGEPGLAPAPAAADRTGAAPRALAAVVARAMALEPEARYASAEELAAEVARYLDGSRVLAFREGPGEKAARVFARYRTPILLVAAYLAARIFVLFYWRR
jgi:serine/threonine-protein kinase